MCLILFAHAVHPDLPLIIAANRDEFHGRPTATANWWADQPGLLAGRDLKDGGTWIGVHANGRFAAVTNFSEEPPSPSQAPRSRGELTTGFLSGSQTPADYLAHIASYAHEFRGFNLLIGDSHELHYFCNRNGGPRQLPPGVYGLSNSVLDCDWPKVVSGKQSLEQAIATQDHEHLIDTLFAVLGDRTVPPDELLPQFDRNGNRDIELARRVAPRFIVNDNYGTRASTVITVQRAGLTGRSVRFAERSFGPNARDDGRVEFVLEQE